MPKARKAPSVDAHVPELDVHTLMSQLRDETYLDWLVKGKPAFDKNGNPVIVKDEQGNNVQLIRPLNASEMAVIERRLNALGLNKRAAATNKTQALIEEAERRRKNGQLGGKALKLPKVSEEDEGV